MSSNSGFKMVELGNYECRGKVFTIEDFLEFHESELEQDIIKERNRLNSVYGDRRTNKQKLNMLERKFKDQDITGHLLKIVLVNHGYRLKLDDRKED